MPFAYVLSVCICILWWRSWGRVSRAEHVHLVNVFSLLSEANSMEFCVIKWQTICNSDILFCSNTNIQIQQNVLWKQVTQISSNESYSCDDGKFCCIYKL